MNDNWIPRSPLSEEGRLLHPQAFGLEYCKRCGELNIFNSQSFPFKGNDEGEKGILICVYCLGKGR